MAIQQKFYPSFFLSAFKEAFVSSSNKLACRIALFKVGATYDKEHDNYADVSDLVIAGSEKAVEVTLSLNLSEEKLFFDIPDVTWSGANGSFYHAIMWVETKSVLITHINFGGEQNFDSKDEFKLSSNPLCKPYLDVSYLLGCP